MKITFTGVGNSSTTQEYYQSGFVLEQNGKRLLVDCGTDARFALGELGVTNGTVGTWLDAVYITHLHGDHCGGLEWLAFCCYFNKAKPRPKLFISSDLVPDLEAILRVGLNSLKGQSCSLDTFFDVQRVYQHFTWENLSFYLVKGEHVWANNVLMPMYGLWFGSVHGNDSRSYFYSGDTMITPKSREIMARSNLIWHDCETYPNHKSGVHAHYTDLQELPEEVRKRMWLYHYDPNHPQDPVADGFAGWTKKGQVFEL